MASEGTPPRVPRSSYRSLLTPISFPFCLVHSGCCNNYRLGLINNGKSLLQVLEAEIRGQKPGRLNEALVQAKNFSWYPHMVEGTRELSGSPWWGIETISEGSALMANRLPMVWPSTITLEVRFQHVNLGTHSVHRPSLLLCWGAEGADLPHFVLSSCRDLPGRKFCSSPAPRFASGETGMEVTLSCHNPAHKYNLPPTCDGSSDPICAHKSKRRCNHNFVLPSQNWLPILIM